ncbi:EAL domain-containing protein [Aliidiomarina minuta]|uniref:EAL domain-containing protein n=1 Tax=Aliidiomarina minuta TaxID=880057 RepID=A0A432W6Z1_9GAMM|nr:HDOD domain-containing protein [Aliidiomarina minuta]RUO25802.1 EAL domain-containing protein [Aliidiomarina minuta]
MFFYLARQPILNRCQRLFGYELLFRDGEQNAFPNVDDDVATARLIENSQLQHTIAELTEHKLAFINFAEGGLLSDLPRLLSPSDVVIEVLESVTPSPAVQNKLQTLKELGYRIALDDYNFDPEWQKVFPYLSIIKVDLQAYTYRQLQVLKHQIRGTGIALLAEKVETRQQFSDALEDGFEYFQGYFFSKPEMLKKRNISPTKAACTELLAETSREQFDFKYVTEILQRDVALSYRLLRFVNAAAFGRAKKVTSLHQAVIFLGVEEVKRFVTLAVTAALNDDKPSELIRLAITRARFCELLSQHHEHKTVNSNQAFLVGLFSLLDAMFDEELKVALNRLNLTDSIQSALVERRGALAFYLALIEQYEKANWQKVDIICKRLKVDPEQIPELYIQANNWAQRILPDDS